MAISIFRFVPYEKLWRERLAGASPIVAIRQTPDYLREIYFRGGNYWMAGWYVNADSQRVSLMQSVMEICWGEVLARKLDVTRQQMAQAIVAVEVGGEKDAARLAEAALQLVMASRQSRTG